MIIMIISTVLEILVAAFIIYGLFNEDKLVDFEDKLADTVKSYIHSHRRAKKRIIKANLDRTDDYHCA